MLFCLALAFQVNAQSSPNILWLVCEDISPTLSFYGDSTAQTPHLDQLAKEAMVYENAFATVGVCAPSRSSIITGMLPTSIGTMHMRTGKDMMSWGKRTYKSSIPITDIQGDTIREYAVVPPAEVKCFPEYLRAQGYYCTNNQKTDYQFAAPLTAWDENDRDAHWRNCPSGQPFFSVFNFNVTHESKLWKNENLPLTVNPNDVPVPPYLPSDSIAKSTIARHYSNIELLDQQIGRMIAALKADGLYDDTIIFFYSDHGGPLPRQKREAYDSGLRVPLLVKSQQSQQVGRTNRLVSLMDLGPTVMSLAGIAVPKHVEGKAFLGAFAQKERKYLLGTGNRFDGYTDRIRIIRDQDYLYIKNDFPKIAKYKPLKYREQVPLMQSYLHQKSTNHLTDLQASWFEEKASEELYAVASDEHNIHNLASHPSHQKTLKKYRKALLRQTKKCVDLGAMPEAQLIALMWPENKQPQTVAPTYSGNSNEINLTSKTAGTSIAYLISDEPLAEFDFNQPWQLYTTPVVKPQGKYLYVVAERIGYEISEMIEVKLK